jgi:Zn-dependent metalloprotease
VAPTCPASSSAPDDEGPTGDAAADEMWDGLGATEVYLREVHRRRSLDGDGADLVAVVHFGQRYANAFWDGQRIVCGDGDGELFLRFTLALDVVAHEMGHGIVDDETGFEYQGQSGALNEHCADVIGTLVKQHAAGQRADEADWLIGAGLFGPKVSGRALRSMKEPGTAYDDEVLGKDPQPAHFDDFVTTIEDNGGVHINSGIPNRAFHLVATGLGGQSWERAGPIWYAAMADAELTPNADFAAFASATVGAAAGLYGKASPEVRATESAWREVGVIPAG